MIYELLAPRGLSPFTDIFAGLPPRLLGMAIWMLFTVLALLYVVSVKSTVARRVLGVPVPMILAGAIFTGLFISSYNLLDEVAINLKHPYNLFHYGKFSMSRDHWVDGTVEPVYYLLHVPFSWSQHSLIVANYLICLLVGLSHLPLAKSALDSEACPRKNTLLLCGFALCLPLATTFSSGFGNGLESLIFLAAIVLTLQGKESLSLVLSGLLPLLRPDAVALSVINAGVIVVSRCLARRRIFSRQDYALLLIPGISAGIYYSVYRVFYGHWVPTPVFFKAIRLPMFAMTFKVGVIRDIVVSLLQGTAAVALICIVLIARDFFRRSRDAAQLLADRRVLSLGLYALATMPLFLFYSVANNTRRDFTFGAYPRYWVAFDLTLQLFVLAVLAKVHPNWATPQNLEGSLLTGWRQHAALVAFLCLSFVSSLGNTSNSILHKPGRRDGMFAGGFTQRYLPADLTISTTEMDTFGLMIERPVIDLWGYTTPEIAHSGVCNGERIRNNDRYFLQVKPDIYWPYWFTTGLAREDQTASFDNAEESLATFHHTNKNGDHLGDMTQVFEEYDLVVIRTEWNHLAYLVRKKATGELVESLMNRGFSTSRERPINLSLLHSLYDGQKRVTYRCP